MPVNLITTLLPEDPTRLREIEHLAGLVKQVKEAGLHDQIEFTVASAHQGALEQAAFAFARHDYSHYRLLPTGFIYDPERHDQRRGHEIAYSKRRIAADWHDRQTVNGYGWVFYYDSDVELRLADILRFTCMVARKRAVKFPYCASGRLNTPGVQFGIFLHHGDVGRYSDVVYQQVPLKGKKVTRNGAPDCNIRDWMVKKGIGIHTAHEVRTRHWRSREKYWQFFAGHRTEHRRLEDLDFDPVVSGHAMDITAVRSIRDFLKGRTTRRTLDLGTGSGNGTQLLMSCGAEEILSVDQNPRWAGFVRRQCANHPRSGQCAIKFQTLPLQKNGAYYFGRSFRPFDVVLVDGPCNHPHARIRTARKIPSACYVFHDWNRDKALIRGFAASKPGYKLSADVAGRGVAFLVAE